EGRLLAGGEALGDVDRAATLLAEVDRLSPQGAEAALLHAEAELLRARAGAPGAWAAAAAAVERARRRSPARAHPLARSALFHRYRLESPAASPRDIPDGLRFSRAALAIDPASPEALLLAGFFAARSGHAAEARALLARGKEANPLLPRLLGLRPGDGSGPRPPSRPRGPISPGGGRAAPPSP
ncbi:MAG: hypothetical protein KJ062_19615, partial [Thermoanaerobaculia bacterium]|nr:hypothetical protein [Thermoanaerobaculia bacterium]